MKMTKKRKAVEALVDKDKRYSIGEAVSLVKKTSYTKFDASVDVDMRLGVDPRKSTEMVRGVVTLPNGTGRTLRTLVLCTPEKEAEAKEAGADMVGLDEYIEKIKGGWLEFDVVVTMPQVMGKIGQLGRVLGPRGLMPNPKSGTVTMEIGKAVKEVKMGKIDFRVDKFGIVHASVGRVSFNEKQLEENVREFLQAVVRLKPASLKGTYIRSVYLSSTMGPGVSIDLQQLQ